MNLGTEEGGGHIFEGGLSAGDYVTIITESESTYGYVTIGSMPLRSPASLHSFQGLL